MDFNGSDTVCDDVSDYSQRSNCKMSNYEDGRLDAVAMIRIMSSLIGLLGAGSIIFSAIIRKRIFSAEIHPIFMLSLADCVLSVLWICGSSLWLSDNDDQLYNTIYCYPVTLLTAMFECVALNLTLVYSILAYLRTKNTELHSLIIPYGAKRRGMSLRALIIMYVLAWTFPMIIISLIFAISAETTGFLSMTTKCSCWCRPTVINVLPFDVHHTSSNDSSQFMNKQFKLVLSLAAFIALEYVVVFCLLMVLYIKTLLKIRSFKREYESHREVYSYGATAILAKGQSRAAKKVTSFLTVFVFSGLFNLCCTLLIFVLLAGKKDDFGKKYVINIYYAFLFAQSLTLPLQGFLNAIVYGWTREDFVSTISYPLQHDRNDDGYTDNETEDDREKSFLSTYDSNCASPRQTL